MVSPSAPKETPENTVPFSNTSFTGLLVLICINPCLPEAGVVNYQSRL
jgi:hypothetical protein